MQGYVPDGHALSVPLVGRGVEEPTEGKVKTGGKSSIKMVVKNAPFGASKRDIRELFGFVIYRFVPFRSTLIEIRPQRSWAAEICAPSQEV